MVSSSLTYKITGFADKHACIAPGWYKWTNALKEFGAKACPPDNVGHMDMVVYLVETGGVRTLIWGDNRHDPAPCFREAVGQVDAMSTSCWLEAVCGARQVLHVHVNS